MNKVFLLSVAAAVFTSTLQAQSIVVDFEDLSTGNNGLFVSNGSLLSRGFNVAHSGSFAILHGTAGQGGTDFSGNGTNRLLSFNTSTITLSRVGGVPFGLSAFDGGESWVNLPHFWATQIQVTGYYEVGGTTTQFFGLDLVKSPTVGMQVFSTNGSFTGLSKVEFVGIGGNPEFSIDNMVTSTVPEPQTVALLVVGLAVVAGASRRRATLRQG